MSLTKKSAFFNGKKICLFLLWGFLTYSLLREIKPETVNLLFAAGTFLLYSHILYGGYFLFKSGGLTRPVLAGLILLIYFHLIKLVQSLDHIFFWYLILISLFIIAIVFHACYKFYSQDAYLKRVCNFKIYVEVLAIISSASAILAYPWLKDNLWFLGAVNIFVILVINWFILVKKNIYQNHNV